MPKHDMSEPSDEAGFSIVEMVIAMFLLAILALAVLPLLIGATQASAVNRTLVAANTYANAQIAPIRDAFPNSAVSTTCTSVAAKTKTNAIDPSATGLSADVTVSACPAQLPGTVTVTAKVYKTGSPSSVLVSLPTKILVTAP